MNLINEVKYKDGFKPQTWEGQKWPSFFVPKYIQIKASGE